MPRTAGAKNKVAIAKTNITVEFLFDALHGHAKWLEASASIERTPEERKLALEYAEAYQVLLNRFSQLPTETE